MTRSTRLAGLAMLAGLSSATAQRSTITREAFRLRADSLVFTYLAESRAPSAAFAVIRDDTLSFGAHGLANVEAWRALPPRRSTRSDRSPSSSPPPGS